MNYAEMSDFEINKAVAVALGGVATTDFKGLAIYDMGESQPLVVSQCMHSKGDFLPCNSWADAGPIIQSSLIDLEAIYEFTDDSEQEIEPTGVWAARGVTKFFVHPRSESTNPLRAAMIVFIMMQESEHDA